MRYVTSVRAQIAITIVLTTAVFAHAQAPATAPTTQQHAVIKGRVTAPVNKPVAGAKISVFGIPPRDRATGAYPFLGDGVTDADGRFAIAVSAGIVTVAVQAESFGLCLVQGWAGVEEPMAIELSPAATVKVQVVDSAGRPAPGVRVAPSYIGGGNTGNNGFLPGLLKQQLTTSTDLLGVCTFPSMPAGSTIRFVVDDDRFVGGATTANLISGVQPPDPIKVEQAGIIQGRVLSGDPAFPPAHVQVGYSITRLDGGQYVPQFVETDADGNFRIASVPAGKILLQPLPHGSLASHVAGMMTSVDLARGQILGDQLLVLDPGTPIRGKVAASPTGRPVPGATVILAPQFRTRLEEMRSTTLTAEDGSYEIRAMPGDYAVSIVLPPQANLQPSRTGGRDIVVEAGKPLTVDFVFPPRNAPLVGEVNGTVVDELDQPVADALVICGVDPTVTESAGGGFPGSTLLTTTTDSAGKFRLNVIGWSARLYVHKGDRGLVESIRILPENRNPRVVLKKTAGTAVIHVADPQGKPIQGAVVRVVTYLDENGLTARWGTTGPEGTFTLLPAYPDRFYQIRVGAPGYQPFEQIPEPRPVVPTADGRVPPDPAALRIEPGRTMDYAPIVLQPAAK